MTTLIATEGIPTITTDLPHWQPATWEDYLSDRDNYREQVKKPGFFKKPGF